MSEQILLEDLHNSWHNLANYLTVATLTLELCGSSGGVTQDDYRVLQENINLALKSLNQARKDIQIIDRFFLPNEEKEKLAKLVVA